jgi:hypothetical protein
MFKGNSFASNTSTSLQTTLAAGAQLSEEQFVLEKQTLNLEVSLMYTEQELEDRVSKAEGQDLEPR